MESCTGTTITGGGSASGPNLGTAFSLTLDGDFTLLHHFGGLEGAYPLALIRAADGSFYGTAAYSIGRTSSRGTVFRMDADGAAEFVAAFTSGAEGALPNGTLVEAQDGTLFGTTAIGGLYDGGAVFTLNRSGDYAVIHSFAGGSADGWGPTGLILGRNGNFYGTTAFGGAFGQGTVFRMAPEGGIDVLHHFRGTDGSGPTGITQAADGTFYGLTRNGGVSEYYRNCIQDDPRLVP